MPALFNTTPYPRLVVGCNYHTTWQSHRAMRFVLVEIDYVRNRAKLETRRTNKSFWTDIKDLIFIDTEHNQRKADLLEAEQTTEQ